MSSPFPSPGPLQRQRCDMRMCVVQGVTSDVANNMGATAQCPCGKNVHLVCAARHSESGLLRCGRGCKGMAAPATDAASPPAPPQLTPADEATLLRVDGAAAGVGVVPGLTSRKFSSLSEVYADVSLDMACRLTTPQMRPLVKLTGFPHANVKKSDMQESLTKWAHGENPPPRKAKRRKRRVRYNAKGDKIAEEAKQLHESVEEPRKR